jgi:hypothetical protein
MTACLYPPTVALMPDSVPPPRPNSLPAAAAEGGGPAERLILTLFTADPPDISIKKALIYLTHRGFARSATIGGTGF